jgi:tungstate transport system ATP-binding protein
LDEVMNHPVNEFVASLVGVENILVGKVIRRNKGKSLVSVSGKEIETPEDFALEEEVSLCIRPENVVLSDIGSAGIAGTANNFPANVGRITPMGPYQKVQLDCGFPLVTYVTGCSLSALCIKEGTTVFASFDTMAVHAIRKGRSVDP